MIGRMLTRFDEAAVAPPDDGGLISGPCGALLSEAADEGVDADASLADAHLFDEAFLILASLTAIAFALYLFLPPRSSL